MVESGGGQSFPVLFFDGEREMNIGSVKISPNLEYKPFQLMLSQKIGISPNQISIYLIDRKKSAKSDDRRRVPITGKVNFAVICRQKDCGFLVVLKRSRKSRNRRERMISGVDFADYLPEKEFSPPPHIHPVPENLILLRRNQPMPFYDQITQSELADLNDRLQSLRFHRENYQMAMANNHGFEMNPNPYLDQNTDPYTKIDEFYPTLAAAKTMMTKNETKKFYCEECKNAKKDGNTTAFHHCVNDAVINMYSTRFGSIGRPNKPAR